MSLSDDMPARVPTKPFRTEGFRRIWRAVLYSLEGLGAALKHEAAFRQECLAALVLIPAALLLDFTAVEKVLLIGVVFLVLIIELMNSAVECCVDYISTDLHPSAKRAKDISSAAVLLSLTFAFVTWGIIIVANWPLFRGG